VNAAAELIARLGLKPHPEGGWYREVHRADERVETPRGPRAAITTIYYLLEQAQLSRWHVVSSDEIWHFHAGTPLELLVYRPETRVVQRNVLGPPTVEQQPIGIVRAGEWQAARSLGAYSLVGCDVGPGFEFEDFRFVTTLAGHETHFTGELARYTGLL
jgi:predicted cupin superfamily sugar epimerase